MLLHTEQYQIYQREQLLDILVPNRSVGVDADVDALLLQSLDEWYQRLRLNGWLATAEGYTTALAEEGLLADSLFDDMLQVGLFCLATKVYSVGVSAIQAAEIAPLQEYHQSQAWTIECSERLV